MQDYHSVSHKLSNEGSHAYVMGWSKISDVGKMPKNGTSGKSRVAESKMAQFSKNGFFCVLHTYFQDLKGVRILPGQKWEMPPTLVIARILSLS